MATEIEAKLVVRDLVGEPTTRIVRTSSCERAKHALALFIAVALDEGPSVTPAATADRDVARWPEPAPARAASMRRPGRRGSGGVGADIFVGMQAKGRAPTPRGLSANRRG